MGERNRILVTAALILIAAAAIGVLLKKFVAKRGPPAWVLETLEEKIDTETLEVLALPVEKWRKLGEQGGAFKNPRTGKYTMVSVIVCASCGQKIPAPGPGYSPRSASSATVEGGTAPTGEKEEPPPPMGAVYICPRCGRPAR